MTAAARLAWAFARAFVADELADARRNARMRSTPGREQRVCDLIRLSAVLDQLYAAASIEADRRARVAIGGWS